MSPEPKFVVSQNIPTRDNTKEAKFDKFEPKSINVNFVCDPLEKSNLALQAAAFKTETLGSDYLPTFLQHSLMWPPLFLQHCA